MALPHVIEKPLATETVELVSSKTLWEGGLSQDIGDRKKQEDAARSSTFTNKQGQQFTIAVLGDGVGGHPDGEIASNAVVGRVASCLEREWLGNPEIDQGADPHLINLALDASVQQGSKALGRRKDSNETRAWAEEHLPGVTLPPDARQSAATTLIAAAINDNHLYLRHAGDSRAYLIPELGDATQLTSDHTVRGSLQRSGRPVDENTPTTLMLAITGEPDENPLASIERVDRQLNPTDAVLLCTDGLYNLLTSAQIADIIRSASSAQEAATNLISVAKQIATETNVNDLDNLTALVLKHT